MIAKRTVLVLGAGASVPYGFPTGRELLLAVSKRLSSGEASLLNLLSRLNMHSPGPGEFGQLLAKSMQPSIDAFVENRPKFLDAGKIAIAVGLIPFEKKHVVETRKSEMKWYEYLFHCLGPSIQDIEASKLTVVTFNYDRSLEYFLHNALSRSFELDTQALDALYSSVPIIHVHGHLGEPHFRPGNSRDFSPTLDLSSARRAVSSLIIPGAEDFDTKPFELARQAISSAEVVCFLGFSFHRPNVDRLSIVKSPNRQIYACAYQMPPNVISTAKSAIPDAVVFGRPDQTALPFLQNHPVLE